MLLSELQTLDVGTHLGTVRRHILDGTLNGRYSVGTSHREGAGNHAGDIHRVQAAGIQAPSITIAVLCHRQSGTTEEAHSVKVLRADVTNIVLQLGELRIIVGLISRGLGTVQSQGGQLTHAIQSLTDFL